MAPDVAVSVNVDELQVIWPLHKHHYLTALLDVGSDMTVDQLEASEPMPVSSTGCDLAARALVAGAACTQQRVSELLETSPRSVGRAVDSNLVADWNGNYLRKLRAARDCTVPSFTFRLLRDTRAMTLTIDIRRVTAPRGATRARRCRRTCASTRNP
jgi:hypothetical protein